MARKGRRKLESSFQSEVIHELKRMWPDSVVRKNPPGYDNGFPDIVAYVGDTWGMFECKRSEHERHRPNQDWWVERLNEMSFARFIFPENKDEVLREFGDYVRGNSRTDIYEAVKEEGAA